MGQSSSEEKESGLRGDIERARSGDPAAFDRLAAHFRGRLSTLAILRLGARPQAASEVDDVVQETFLRALRSVREFQGQELAQFYAWLRRIAELVVLETARRRLPHELTEAPADSDRVSPSRALRRRERFDRLKEALEQLSPDHRQVIVWARLEGVPIKEIALRMARSPDAISNLLARALESLRRVFGATETFHLPPELSLGADRLETEAGEDSPPRPDQGPGAKN